MITQCKDCSKNVSSDAIRCPHCGAKLRMSTLSRAALWLGGAAATVFVIAWVSYEMQPAYVKEAKKIRAVCERIAGPLNREACDRAYATALQTGAPGYQAPRDYKAEAEQAEKDMQRREALKPECMSKKPTILGEYDALAAKGEWWLAGLKVWNCAEATQDPDFVKRGDEARAMDKKSSGKK